MGIFTAILEEGLYQVDKVLNSINKELIPEDINNNYNDKFIGSKEIVNTANTGFCCDGINYLPSSTANFLVTGNSGVGKSSVIAHTLLGNTENNYIINDCSGELSTSAGVLYDANFDIKITNFSRPEISNGFFNPLKYVDSDSSIYKLSHQIAHEELGKDRDKYWMIQACNLLGLNIRALRYQDPKYFNLTNVRHVIEMLSGANTSLVDKIIIDTKNDSIINAYKSFISNDPKLKSNIISSTLACLSIWNDSNIQQITSFDSLDLHNIHYNKYAIFIQTDVLQSSYYRLLVSLLLKTVITEIMTELPNATTRRTLLLLDEFASGLYIPDFDIIISTIRKYRAHLCLIIQSYSQLQSQYGDKIARTIITNCASRLYFSSLDFETASSLSNELGKYSHMMDSSMKIRELLTPSEIRQLSADKAILLYSNMNPILLNLRPCYTQPLLMRRLKKKFDYPRFNVNKIIPLIGYS